MEESPSNVAIINSPGLRKNELGIEIPTSQYMAISQIPSPYGSNFQSCEGSPMPIHDISITKPFIPTMPLIFKSLANQVEL